MIEQKLILITLLIKLGVAAAVSSALARARTFQRYLEVKREKMGHIHEVLEGERR